MKIVLSNDLKQEMIHVLMEQGYSPYARLLRPFDLYLTDDINFVGGMQPGKARIILNKYLSPKEASLVLRHEILHEFLDHEMRMNDYHIASGKKGSHHTANVAMDFDISNQGYTDADKSTVRGLTLQTPFEKLKRNGLVTEDQYPGWEDLTFEEMYDKLVDMQGEDQQKLQKIIDKFKPFEGDMDLDDMDIEIDNTDDSDSNDDNDSQTGQPLPNNSDSNKPEDKKSDDNDQTTSGSSSTDSKLDKEKEELSDKIDQAQDDLDKLDSNKKGVLDTEAERKERERIAANVAEIQRLFRDLKNKEDILNATKQVKQKEKAAARAQDAERRHSDPLQMFKLNLNRFIKDQISEIEDDTYTRINPSYEDSDFLVPGRQILDNKFIPKINVYHDVSGSFDDPAKTEMAMRAIDSLQKYKRQGDIELDVFYFADRVSSTREGAGLGTRGTPIQEHIKLTKPTNVIIITDGDIDDCREVVTVPGAVWMLFYGSESRNVQECVRGKKQNKYFNVTWSKK